MKKLTEEEKKHHLHRSETKMESLSAKKRAKVGTETPRPYKSDIIGFLNSREAEPLRVEKVDSKKFHAVVEVPTTFSIIETPKKSLLTIFNLARTIRRRRKVTEYAINHSKMEKVDLAAESILDLVVVEMKRECRLKRKKFNFSGTLPADEGLKRLLKGFGIIKSLGIKDKYLPPSQEEELKTFKGHSTRGLATGAGSMSDAERVAKKLVDYINECLAQTDRKLTQNAVAQLATYAGEMMDNANEHSGKATWFIKGYYDPYSEPGYCEIAFVNFGKTIAETLSGVNQNSRNYKDISPYLTKHSKPSRFSPKWDEADLLTVMSLQRGISSKNKGTQSTRGMGTIEMIGFFEAMTEECSADNKPEMAILSGSTHIRFDGKYRMSKKGIIAFNKENDLKLPPDPNYVSNIKPLHFPGSIISIRFTLSETQSLPSNHE